MAIVISVENQVSFACGFLLPTWDVFCWIAKKHKISIGLVQRPKSQGPPIPPRHSYPPLPPQPCLLQLNQLLSLSIVIKAFPLLVKDSRLLLLPGHCCYAWDFYPQRI